MRKSGVLNHITSLPNDYGIGKMGNEAKEFVDFLVKAGQSIWQILPLSQTSYGDSPYQSFSIYAGNPYLIDFEQLEVEGLLKPEEYKALDWGNDETSIDFGILYVNIFK
ncbi:MAG: 4-alpha-glucanotransferase, partial [Clostridiales bacterium]|nr:4-alpha-glucanotransferase [Clostridiales bacterium]